MIRSQEFNPFNILPRQLMLLIMLQTFAEEGHGSLDIILDYQKANKDFTAILSDESNLKYIFDSLPQEFNIAMYPSLRRRMITTEEGRYRAGLALLFLKYLYEHVKPFPNDDFLINHYNDYHTSLKYLEEYFVDYPMPMYICGFVSFYISKRLLTLNPLDKDLQEKGAEIYNISTKCIIRADELEHPLAKIFYADMDSQLQRMNVRIEDFNKVNSHPNMLMNLSDLIKILDEKLSIDISKFDDETQTLLFVTWRKLALENYYHARDLFSFSFQNNKLIQLTEYFYRCYQVNHFHRHTLAFNPLFMHIENKENILFLLEKFSIDSLVDLHQSFRVNHPHPDSILLTTILTMNKSELNDIRSLISDILTLPQKENSGWRFCFHEAYRNAIDESTLKTVSPRQMKMVLHYFILVNHYDQIESILERDASIPDCVFHCRSNKVHDIALAVFKQIIDFTRSHSFTRLYQKEMILKLIYQDCIFLSTLKLTEQSDFTKIASMLVDTFAKMIIPQLPDQEEMKVYDYIFNNKALFREFTEVIHQKLRA